MTTGSLIATPMLFKKIRCFGLETILCDLVWLAKGRKCRLAFPGRALGLAGTA
jgi:hypothetical protein